MLDRGIPRSSIFLTHSDWAEERLDSRLVEQCATWSFGRAAVPSEALISRGRPRFSEAFPEADDSPRSEPSGLQCHYRGWPFVGDNANKPPQSQQNSSSPDFHCARHSTRAGGKAGRVTPRSPSVRAGRGAPSRSASAGDLERPALARRAGRMTHVLSQAGGTHGVTRPPPHQNEAPFFRTKCGYTEHDKPEIAKRYLVSRQLKENGLRPEQCPWDDSALRSIIEAALDRPPLDNRDGKPGQARRVKTHPRRPAHAVRRWAVVSVRSILAGGFGASGGWRPRAVGN